MQELVVTILLGLLALGGLGMLLWGRSPKSNMTKRQKKTLLRIVEATALLLLLQLLPPLPCSRPWGPLGSGCGWGCTCWITCSSGTTSC